MEGERGGHASRMLRALGDVRKTTEGLCSHRRPPSGEPQVPGMEGNELSPLGGTERKPVWVRQVPAALLFPPPPAALWDWSLAGAGTSLATGPRLLW